MVSEPVQLVVGVGAGAGAGSAGEVIAGGALSLAVFGGVAGVSAAGCGETGAGVRGAALDAWVDALDLVLLATIFGELFALVAAGSCELDVLAAFVVVVVALAPESATTTGAGGGDDSAWVGVDDATFGVLSDMAWSYTNAPPITLAMIVPKAIPK